MAPIAKTFKNVTQKVINNHSVFFGYVERTDAWFRQQLSSKIQEQFNKAVERNANIIKPNAVGIYLQYLHLSFTTASLISQIRHLGENSTEKLTIYRYRETPHSSNKYQRNHFTALQVDENDTVIATNHLEVEDD